MIILHLSGDLLEKQLFELSTVYELSKIKNIDFKVTFNKFVFDDFKKHLFDNKSKSSTSYIYTNNLKTMQNENNYIVQDLKYQLKPRNKFCDKLRKINGKELNSYNSNNDFFIYIDRIDEYTIDFFNKHIELLYDDCCFNTNRIKILIILNGNGNGIQINDIQNLISKLKDFIFEIKSKSNTKSIEMLGYMKNCVLGGITQFNNLGWWGLYLNTSRNFLFVSPNCIQFLGLNI